MSNPFKSVRNLNPGRSVFNLSYSKLLSGFMGYLYPVQVDEVVPGDVWDIGVDAVIRLAPMIAPILHEVMLKADVFFVPYRLLYSRTGSDTNNWERFITGGRDGQDAITRGNLGVLNLTGNVTEGGLWDHLGIPTGVHVGVGYDTDSPMLFPGMAYRLIYNEYYRDPNLEAPLDITATSFNSDCLPANWGPDYFTRALPQAQRGVAAGLPISGTGHAIWPAYDAAGNSINVFNDVNGKPISAAAKAALDNNTVDFSAATSITINDLRLATQLQRWMERNNRAGYRYVEELRSHFGVAPRDDRLDRPEYIGGVRQPIIISEVLQTSKSETNAPQGNLAGHGIMAGSHYIGRYHVLEYGLIMTLMSVVPKAAYMQGINRQWLRETRYDYYFPEFAHLGDQAIRNEEIYLQHEKVDNVGVWGYQGRYDEMRYKGDMVAGTFRSSLNFWHLGRIFDSLPSLSSTFGKIDPATLTRIFAVPASANLYIHWGNKIRAIRPLPLQAEPGALDHSYGE